MHFVKDDVVISGVGGYFPKSLNIEQFRDRLLNNENLMESRWKAGERGVTNVIGKVPTEFFDNAYFGIHRQQCTFMDPMHRLILERTYEAIVDAGVNPSELRGRRIGCFMGSSVGENDNLFLESVVSGFGVTGHSRAMMPNRVSYWLDLKGPSVAYDSNWIGGIEVLRLAYEAIKTGQCEAVLVGTANLALNSEFQWLYNDMGLLSPDGSNKCYDIDAQGYARSDGVVVMYIQRSSEARRSYASIVNVATQFDGNRDGTLLDIDANNMAEFISDFYKETNVDPSEVEFVEAYGSALKETDRKELEALEKVFCKNRKTPLLIGSVKPNTGHSEASASLFSVVKVLIAMETETIPATIQFKTPNPNIKPLINGSIKVVTENQKWGVKYAAVNAIGLDSYYGHILLKANPKRKTVKELQDNIPRVVLASTRTEEGIKEILETIKSNPDPEYIKLVQSLYAKPILGHLYRGYTLLGSQEPKEESEYYVGNKRQTWFVFSGMGSQWCGMVSDLMKIPVFADAINRCHNVLKPKGIDLMHIISTDEKTNFDTILHSFVGIAAIQIALTDVLKAVGIVPDGIIGHSVGELGCAYADGCMTAEQMILSAYSRGRASIEASLIKGMMAAIGMGYQQIKDKCPPSIEVACHNGPDSSTISGPTEDMEKFVKDLQDQGIFARLVNVANIAYHSRYIKPAAPALLDYLKKVLPEPMPRSSKWISTSNLEENWNTDLAKHSSPEYHTNNLLSSVYFEEGLKHIPKDSVLIEIAPHGLLQAILKRSLKSGCTNVPLTHRGAKSGVEFLLSALGKLYLAGLNMDVSKLFPPIEYPVSRGTPCLANLSHWEHSETWRTGLEEKLKSLFGVRDFQVTLNSEEFRECVGHQVDDKIILPCTSYLSTIFEIVASISTGHKAFIFENLHFKKALTIPRVGSVALHAMIQKGSGDFEILAGNDIIVTGRLTFPNTSDKFMIDPIKVKTTDDNIYLSGSDVYNEFQHRGHKYSGSYKTIKNLTITEDGSVATVQWANKWATFMEAMLQLHLFQDGERYQEIYLPKNVHKIIVDQELLPTEKKDIEVHYDFSTGLISAEGIQIVGVKAVSFPTDPKPISFDSVEFTPLTMTTLPNIETGINMAVQIALDNFEEQFINNISITEIESRNASLMENIQNVCNQFPKLNQNLATAKDIKGLMIQSSYPFLLVLNDVPNEDIIKIISTSHGFLLSRTDKSILSNPQIVQIAQFVVNGIDYSILRKAKQAAPAVVTVTGDTLSLKHLSRNSLPWVNALHQAVEASKSKNSNVFLISSLVPTEGLKNFVDELLSQPNMSTVRVLFILDKTVGTANINKSQLQQIFRFDLALSVIKDGVFGTVLSVPIKLKGDIQSNLNITSGTINNKIINYVGVNLKDETLLPATEKKTDLGNIDYSGVTTNGQKVMGLAQLNRDECKLESDSILSWDVPDKWTLEDAATIPHAYVSAYYCLCVKGRLKVGETVLIHAGCSSIGLAALNIAFHYKCNVYTTVSTEAQRNYLKKQFSGLQDDHILSSDDSKFEPLLLIATGGVGAHVIINNLSGSLLQSSVGCLAEYGRLIQIGKYDLEENNSFGMSVFLKNTSFYVVGLENVFLEPQEIKRDIKSMVQKGIDDGSIKPLNRKIEDHQSIAEILKSLSSHGNIGKILIKINNNLSLSKFILNNPSQFICDSKNSYLVYGGTSENWTDTVEWLILRGARKIVVASDSKPQQTYINRRLSLLQSYFGASIIYAPPKTHTREGASELLSEVYLLGPIHCVFLLQNKSNNKVSDTKSVQYIDQALRTAAPKAALINFINNVGGVCQFRSEAGFLTYNIQWQKDLDFSEVLCGLDQILSYRTKDILVKNDKVSDSHQETVQSLFKKLALILPSSLEDFVDELQSAPSEPDLIQLPTLGPREMRELSPVFVIPGLSGTKEMKDMAFQLLYPTFCAVYPSTPMSIKELAASLVEKIKKVWPKGAYNIIGVSWGGGLMVEIAKILDKLGDSLHLYFVDGAPGTLQSAVKHLGETSTAVETNLLTRMLKITDNELVKKIEASPNWETRLKIALSNYDNNTFDAKSLGEGLLTLKSHLQSLMTVQPSEELISGQVHLIRPTGSSQYDNCGLVSYCKQTPQITLATGDHLSIINNLATTEYINEKHYLI